MTAPSMPASRHRRRHTQALFERSVAQPPGDERARTMGAIVILNVPVARSIARRYRDRGCELEDLEQTAYLALVRAVDHFDVASGHDFLAYAVPSIRGEVMRYFRDIGWMVRPPRSVQELQPRVRAVQHKHQQLASSTLGIDEIAARVGVTPQAVRQALLARGCFTPTSLDLPVGEGGLSVLGDVISWEDPGFAAAEARILLDSILVGSSDLERSVLQLRFVEELTQSAVAERLQLTQPQVSRLLQQLLARLRSLVTDPAVALSPVT